MLLKALNKLLPPCCFFLWSLGTACSNDCSIRIDSCYFRYYGLWLVMAFRHQNIPRSFSPSILSCSLLRPWPAKLENCQLRTSDNWLHVARGGFPKNARFCAIKKPRVYTSRILKTTLYISAAYAGVGRGLVLSSRPY